VKTDAPHEELLWLFDKKVVPSDDQAGADQTEPAEPPEGFTKEDWEERVEHLLNFAGAAINVRKGSDMRRQLAERAEYDIQVRRHGFGDDSNSLRYFKGNGKETGKEAADAGEIKRYKQDLNGNILAGHTSSPASHPAASSRSLASRNRAATTTWRTG
jgi:hypothetical protein